MEHVVERRNILVSEVLMVIVALSITGVEPLLITVVRVVKRDSVLVRRLEGCTLGRAGLYYKYGVPKRE